METLLATQRLMEAAGCGAAGCAGWCGRHVRNEKSVFRKTAFRDRLVPQLEQMPARQLKLPLLKPARKELARIAWVFSPHSLNHGGEPRAHDESLGAGGHSFGAATAFDPTITCAPTCVRKARSGGEDSECALTDPGPVPGVVRALLPDYADAAVLVLRNEPPRDQAAVHNVVAIAWMVVFHRAKRAVGAEAKRLVSEPW